MQIKIPFIAVLITVFSIIETPSASATTEFPGLLERAFVPSFAPQESNLVKNQSDQEKMGRLERFCAEIGAKFKKYNWEDNPCGKVAWKMSGETLNNNPLLYASFGNGRETTLLLSAVHPNEITPIPMGFRLARYIQDNPSVIKPHQRLVVAPLINPDGFLIDKPQRTNSRGVDPNRNFFTLDWYEKSHSWWQSGRKKNLAYFPGHFPNSEIETIFQIRLVDDFQPDKILSIHAPLGFLDYDGPGDQNPGTLNVTETQAKMLAAAISKKSNNYGVVDYSFYPGSLGNFAGNERHIPTVTLELATTDASKVDDYWKQFLPGILEAINYPFKKNEAVKNKLSRFYSHYETLDVPLKDRS